MYRILRASHHRTGDTWCIYPMYDWAHGQCDSIEGITHSICTLEFTDHRPLYDWFLDALGIYHSQQIEFARLNLTYTVMSKRRLLQLVQEGHVGGWDDARMPTISGLRRRGYTPESIREFADRIGVARSESTSEMALLEDCLRDDLNKRARRFMAVLHPLEARDRQLRCEPGGASRRGKQPRGSRRGNPECTVLARAVHRAGGFPRGPSEEIFPPFTGRRGPPSVCVHREMHRRHQGSSYGRSQRDPLHP